VHSKYKKQCSALQSSKFKHSVSLTNVINNSFVNELHKYNSEMMGTNEQNMVLLIKKKNLERSREDIHLIQQQQKIKLYCVCISFRIMKLMFCCLLIHRKFNFQGSTGMELQHQWNVWG